MSMSTTDMSDPVLTSRAAIHSPFYSSRGLERDEEGEMKEKRQRQTQLAPLHGLRFSPDVENHQIFT